VSVFFLPGPAVIEGFSPLKILVALFSLYAAGLILAFVTFPRKLAPSVFVAVQCTDILWGCAFAASIQSIGPVLLVFVFPMLTATFRWGAPATLGTSLAIVAGLEGLTEMGLFGVNNHLAMFQTSGSVILLGLLFAHVGQTQRQASNVMRFQAMQGLPSGTPSQIVQSVCDRAFATFRPKCIQLLVDEVATGRTFLWHAEENNGRTPVVHSEEFDQASGSSHPRMMPEGDWTLSRTGPHEKLLITPPGGDARVGQRNIPATFSSYFKKYTTVMSAGLMMTDGWAGRIIICDPSTERSRRTSLQLLRQFCDNVASSVHTAHLCLRACRVTAAEERARLARELHDGVIQSLLSVDLRLERLKRQTGKVTETQDDIREVQGILRNEALALRQLVDDSRRRALNPERLLEYLSDLLERFQRDSGFMTHFFADLDPDPMPSRICYEIARITEEAIINAKKHSKGSNLIVRVGNVADNWLLLITDDGVGFDFRGAWSLKELTSSGLGPRVIKERVQSLGGGLLIESTSTGARIEITLPKNDNSRSELFWGKQQMAVRA
jgi:signal transduction histidine kinase